ncbi:MAG: hypothetical protein WAK56_23675 [Candidatus Sulfotelmatobacter sp.]
MELLQSFVFDLMWLFFAVWGTALITLAVIAFKPDILTTADQSNPSAELGTRAVSK